MSVYQQQPPELDFSETHQRRTLIRDRERLLDQGLCGGDPMARGC